MIFFFFLTYPITNPFFQFFFIWIWFYKPRKTEITWLILGKCWDLGYNILFHYINRITLSLNIIACKGYLGVTFKASSQRSHCFYHRHNIGFKKNSCIWQSGNKSLVLSKNEKVVWDPHVYIGQNCTVFHRQRLMSVKENSVWYKATNVLNVQNFFF